MTFVRSLPIVPESLVMELIRKEGAFDWFDWLLMKWLPPTVWQSCPSPWQANVWMWRCEWMWNVEVCCGCQAKQRKEWHLQYARKCKSNCTCYGDGIRRRIKRNFLRSEEKHKLRFSELGDSWRRFTWEHLHGSCRGGSRGRVQGVRNPPPPLRWSLLLRIRS